MSSVRATQVSFVFESQAPRGFWHLVGDKFKQMGGWIDGWMTDDE